MKKFAHLLLIVLFTYSCASHQLVYKTSTKNIPIEESVAQENSELVNLLKPYKQNLEADMSRVLAISDVEMEKAKPESNMTNFMADMLLETGRQYSQKNNIALPDIAYVNYGGIRTTLPKGEINVQKVFELMPFENTMVLLKISGENLKKMADVIAQRGGDGIAGVKIGIKNQEASTFLIGGKTFDIKKSYWIVTNDYIASGGDSMNMFLDPEEIISSGITIRDLIITYMETKTKNGQHITAKKDGRIYYE